MLIKHPSLNVGQLPEDGGGDRVVGPGVEEDDEVVGGPGVLVQVQLHLPCCNLQPIRCWRLLHGHLLLPEHVDLLLSEVTGSSVGVNLGDPAGKGGESSADTLDGAESERHLMLAVDVGVQNTEQVLEIAGAR